MSNSSMDLPENYVAFVLPNASVPSPTDLETVRQGTIDYLQRRLQKDFPSLQQLQLEFFDSEFGSQKPAARFHVYIKARATLHFDDNDTIPERNDVFESYISSFTEDYLENCIRNLKAPSLQDAIEVRARRLGPGTPGGAVTAPRFYTAFICSPEPSGKPSRQECDALVKQSQKEWTKLLTDEFEDEFDKLSLKIVNTAINKDAGKPNANYNLLVEWEAVATFHKNPPDGMEFFRAISSPPKGFAGRLKQNIGGCFQSVTNMVIRAVYVETPDLPEDPEDGGEEEEEEGDPDAGEGEEKEKEPNEEKERLQVKVELGFYVALVVKALEALPNPHQLAQFDQGMHEFFTNTLAKEFPKQFVALTLDPTPQYQAGIPLPRFNLVHQYNATLAFYHPPPDGTDVLKKILYCNLSNLYAKIHECKTPYTDMLEFTLGRALEKQVTGQAYGGIYDDREAKAAAKAAAKAEQKRKQQEAARKREEAEAARRKSIQEKKEREEAAKRAKEEKKRQERAAKKAAEEQKRQEAARRAAEEKKRKEEEEAARKAAEEKRRREEEEAARKAAEAKRRQEEEAARRAAEERKRKEQEEAARKAAEEKRRQEEAARKAAEESKRKEAAEVARRAAEEKRRKEEAARKAAEEERKRREEAARKAAAEKAAAEKAAAEKALAEKKRKEEETARREAEARAERERKEAEARAKAAKEAKEREDAERKRKEEAAKAEASRLAEIAKEDETPVGTADVYVAFTLANCMREPSKKEYDDLAAKTQDFYGKHLKKNYSSFERVQVAVSRTCFNQNLPNDRYNVYMEWDIQTAFCESGDDIPDRYELCNSLVATDLKGYMMKCLQPMRGTPFANVRGMHTQSVHSLK